MQAEKALQEEELSHLEKLKGLGVSLTDYLISQHPKPNQVLRVITKGGGQGGHVHIHPWTIDYCPTGFLIVIFILLDSF